MTENLTNVSQTPDHNADADAEVEVDEPMIDDVRVDEVPNLHPNQLAQLDAAFRRHHYLAVSSGIGDILDRNCRCSARGRKKEGLDGNLYYALLLTAVFACHQATVKQMFTVSRTLPLDTRLEFGIIRRLSDGGVTTIAELTRKQLYTMTEGLKKHLDFSQPELDSQQRADRHRIVQDITARALEATHLIDIDHGTYAIDDTAIWSWARGSTQPSGVHGGPDRPLSDEDFGATRGSATATNMPNSPAQEVSEEETDAQEADQSPTQDSAESQGNAKKRNPAPWKCADASWSGKTGKNGQMQAFYGYKAHVIVNTNDPKRQDAPEHRRTGKARKRTEADLPILVQALELTTANADIVDVSGSSQLRV